MNKENEVYKHNGESPQDSTQSSQEPFFSKGTSLTIPVNEPEAYDIATPEKKRWAIIEIIKSNPNCNAYFISKRTKINKSQVSLILRELVFSRVISCRLGLDSFQRSCELFFISNLEVSK